MSIETLSVAPQHLEYGPLLPFPPDGLRGFSLLPLNQGKFAQVDADLFPLLSAFKWTAVKRRGGERIYAYRNVRMADRSIKSVFLHQVVLGFPIRKGVVIDHIDGDGLNNLRSNLRLVTHGDNLTNTRARRRGLTYSAYPGVTWHKNKKRWLARFQINGVSHHIGSFLREIDAAEAYRQATNPIRNQYGIHNGLSQRS